MKGVLVLMAACVLVAAGCVNPAESETLLPPEGDEPDLNDYIMAKYQADVDQAFEAAEKRGFGTFSRIRLDLTVTPEGRIADAGVAISENWHQVVLSALRPRMEEWQLPPSESGRRVVVELIRSVESLRARKKDFRIER